MLFLDKLYWISDVKPPQNIHNAFFFNIDNVSQPISAYFDFYGTGPYLYALQQGLWSSKSFDGSSILPWAGKASLERVILGINENLSLQ